MNRVQFSDGACEKTRRYMDAYISSELLVETNHDVIRHLDSCPACAAELETRSRLRARLKSAVLSQAVPLELATRVREQIRKHPSPKWFAKGWFTSGWFASGWFASGWFASGWFASEWTRYALAAAAVVAISGALWVRPSNPSLPGTPAEQENYIQKVSATVAAVFKPGLGDHIHCAVFLKDAGNPPTVQAMETMLGAPYKGLLPLVAPAVPVGYHIASAHRCSYAGRNFIHLTMRKGDDVISLVITKKNDSETMSPLSPAISASGVPVYQASSAGYRVAGFESGHYLAFVVSDLEGKANLKIAAALAPAVRQLLS